MVCLWDALIILFRLYLFLYLTGIPVTLPDGKQMISRAILLNGTFDLPARCIVCNMMQFNGLCGCGTCEEPGETLKSASGRGHSHIYPMSHEMAKTEDGHADLRTKKKMKADAEKTLKDNAQVI